MRSSYKYIILILFVLMPGLLYSQSQDWVRKSIYPQADSGKSKIYNWMWGRHYRHLYTIPIRVPSATIETLGGGMDIVGQAEGFHGLLLENKRKQLYLLKPLGGSTSFLESKFFREIYNKTDFKNTYLDEFLGDAYTIINPYTFLVADYLAKSAGLSFSPSRIYYIPSHIRKDTVADGSDIQDRLVNLINVPDINLRSNLYTTEDFLDSLQVSKNYMADQNLYIRERIFDMWTGDWNKTNENWEWQSHTVNDSVIYTPIVIDRNHAFTKVDGVLFKQMLKMLSLDFICNYDSLILKDTKKINKLAFALDMAVAGRSDEWVWIRQAQEIRRQMTDSLIDSAFTYLPEGVKHDEIELIKRKLKRRRLELEAVASQYYLLLQRTPVVAGTNQSDYFLIERQAPDRTVLRIYDPETGDCRLEQQFSGKETKELWLYGLAGNDTFEVKGNTRKDFPIYLISGEGENQYQLNHNRKIHVYDKDYKYDYQKIKYHKISFTPWGIYDSDKGISLGTFFTYTMYGFKRAPFTYQHRIGYNYLKGFMYAGIFPNYDGRRRLYLNASISSPRNFENFFGFGNNTAGYKEEKKNYNRVKLRTYMFNPSFEMDLRKEEVMTFFGSLDMYKAKRTDDRYIYTVYGEDHPIFRTNYFVGLGATYRIMKQPYSWLPLLETEWTAGWKMNLKKPERNFPYAQGSLSWNVRFSDRFTWASLMKGTVLFDNDYEFYQAATIDLRGFRDNRFIGKQSFYQYSDLRLDMGKLKNPFTPLKYGLFAGFDYGRVWFPGERSHSWHTSYGGGIWLTFLNKFTTKYSWFGSTDSFRFAFELGLGF
ncbi:hypothetical protein ABHC70_02435 [Parabacteroides distasonis]|uniref:hypothetical protein n=1 Tax=Parabacteroides distasonis TaxID=823 RepID=UPI00325C2564